MTDNRIYVDADEFQRLCRVDGRMDALVSYIAFQEQREKKQGYSSLKVEDIRAIIGMCDE